MSNQKKVAPNEPHNTVPANQLQGGFIPANHRKGEEGDGGVALPMN